MEGVIGWSQRGGYSIMAEPTRSSNKMSTVIYDDRCRLCVNAKKGMERLAQEDSEPQVRFLPYQSQEAERYLGQHYSRGRPEVAFLVGPDGDIRSGLDAFLPLLPGMPGGRFLLAVIRFPSRQTPPKSRLSRSCPAPISLVWRSPSAPGMKRLRYRSSCAWLVLCAPASEGNDKPSG